MSTPAHARPAVRERSPSSNLLVRLLSRLVRAASERGAETVGSVYADAARGLLTRSEQLEDARAARRHQLRASAPRPTFKTSKPSLPKSN
jgi:hypothetical protein